MGILKPLVAIGRSILLGAARILPGLFRPREAIPTVLSHRDENSRLALVLLHGFHGNTVATWGRLIEFLLEEPQIESWDIFSLGYPSSLRIDVPNVWAADPGLDLLVREFRTTLSLSPFERYGTIAIAAHSMGGLIAQKALIDDKKLRHRASHVFLFGTPSAGLPKARFVSMLKRQFRDMGAESTFIKELRSRWSTAFGTFPPFNLTVIAGDRDEFVPPTSSLEPFDDEFRAVIPGNHVEIVKPRNNAASGVRLIVQALSGGTRVRGIADSARLALELHQFRRAVDQLLPLADSLDDAGLSDLALALDGLGRGPEALRLLEQRYHGNGISSTDALGILAGRIKRRWLAERRAEDLSRAHKLYSDGLRQAEGARDHDQGYYHAVNIAFLDLMAAPANSRIPPEAIEMARRALVHCSSSDMSFWRLATEAEANLILGDLQAGMQGYERAIAKSSSPREIDSMYSQAIRVAGRRFGDEGMRRIQELFEVSAENR